MKKNAKNALTSHYANGHGDPCDKWVKNQLAASTANQVHFLGGFAIFHTRSDVGGVWKIAKPPKKFTWLAVETAEESCNFIRKDGGSGTPWGPTIIFSEKKSASLNSMTL